MWFHDININIFVFIWSQLGGNTVVLIPYRHKLQTTECPRQSGGQEHSEILNKPPKAYHSENTWIALHPRRAKTIATQLVRWLKEITVGHYTLVLCYSNINSTYINIKWPKQISTLQLGYKKGGGTFPLNTSMIWVDEFIPAMLQCWTYLCFEWDLGLDDLQKFLQLIFLWYYIFRAILPNFFFGGFGLVFCAWN